MNKYKNLQANMIDHLSMEVSLTNIVNLLVKETNHYIHPFHVKETISLLQDLIYEENVIYTSETFPIASHESSTGKQARQSYLNASVGGFSLQDLEEAFERNEFNIYYQPYFGITSKRFGMEALIRWNHPHFGLLSPQSFLNLAEETGFILKLEKWVLEKAIQEASNLHKLGLDQLYLSVNISAKQLEDPTFSKTVSTLLHNYSFQNFLTLEVTERYLLKKENASVLRQLKETGIRLSIDDFGIAHSTLSYLKDFAFDEIKIDRSFIVSIASDRRSHTIVEMLIKLAHALNLQIVAEGIETTRQLQLLQEMACDTGQGYIYSKPISLQEFEAKYLSSDEKISY